MEKVIRMHEFLKPRGGNINSLGPIICHMVEVEKFGDIYERFFLGNSDDRERVNIWSRYNPW